MKRICLFKDNKYELVVIDWQKGDTIPEHLHPGVCCYFSVLNGQICETKCDSGTATIMGPTESSYIDDNHGSHCVTAIKDSLTFHCYVNKNFLARL